MLVVGEGGWGGGEIERNVTLTEREVGGEVGR